MCGFEECVRNRLDVRRSHLRALDLSMGFGHHVPVLARISKAGMNTIQSKISRGIRTVAVVAGVMAGVVLSCPRSVSAELVLMSAITNSTVAAPLYGAALGAPTAHPGSVVVGSAADDDIFFSQNLATFANQGNVGNVIDTATGLQPSRIYQLTESGFMYEVDLDIGSSFQVANLGSDAITIGSVLSLSGNTIVPFLRSSDGGQTASVYAFNLDDSSIFDFELNVQAYAVPFEETRITGLDAYVAGDDLRILIVDQDDNRSFGYIRDFDLTGTLGGGFQFSALGQAQDATFDQENNVLYVVTNDGGAGTIASFQYEAIPEPGTVGLLILGALGLRVLRRRP